MSDKKTIFLLEDDEAFTVIFRRWLEEAGYRVVTAKTTGEAKKLAESEAPVLFWLDYYLGEKNENGMDFFGWIKTQDKFKATPVIMVSITIDMEKLKQFENQGIRKTFSKTETGRKDILDYVKKTVEENTHDTTSKTSSFP